ncbi:hypothetical protein C7999DRAFT_44271 [Corynascus novoguineensis]|uniref:Uncharacterized protein n=1 Tax=Corynascus novoguineensis TaxID=1126955 RepID=A0AAN7HBT1_9PEZI|nr:hypothetical protein C7999DRAFT_44271 [Corynascus novoguineensis]
MPELYEVSYSHKATVAAVRDYYRFLTRMYLKESYVAEPPEGGWPEISFENLGSLGKTNEAILLLRHLPYISSPDESALGAANCLFMDWRWIARSLALGECSAEDALYLTEGYSGLPKSMSPHVVGLTRGSYYNPSFLLDTKLGVVFWWECHSDIKRNPSREPISGEEYDNGPNEEETDFRCDSVAWAIPDFFELLKDLFRQLFYVPVGPRAVLYAKALKEVMPMLEAIYREHGWPDIERYRKRECLNAIQSLMEERDPGNADRRPEGD